MSIDEKARAYDNILEKARKWYNANTNAGYRSIFENIFPELAESEDDRIRKALRKRIIRYDPNNEILIKEEGISQKQFINWLEKQGESDETKAKAFLINKGYPIDANDVFPTYEEMYNIIREGLEQQSEQNHDDKVEPKFKEGQWIVFNGLTLYINEVVKGYYRTISKGGIRNSYDWDIDNVARLWTLNEAKDGDVLATKDNHICIFDNTVEEGKYPFAYCGLSTYFGFEIYDRTLPFTHDSVYPATREQRDKLEKAMLKAGYKWNTEERKLEKI